MEMALPMTRSYHAISVPVSKLMCYSAFKHPVWFEVTKPITKKEVAGAIRAGFFFDRPLNGGQAFLPEGIRTLHIWRVAYLVVNPDPRPIFVDVGIPHMGVYIDWIVDDGNHRLAAAIFRQDKTIPASISGCVRTIRETLGVVA